MKNTTQQHTPGPWTYQATAGNHDYAVYPEATGKCLALVRDFDEANARLITAAPELLEAAQNARNVLAALATGDLKTISRDSAALVTLRAAIAKATGTESL